MFKTVVYPHPIVENTKAHCQTPFFTEKLMSYFVGYFTTLR